MAAVGDFNAGAMENKGLNIFNTKLVLARPDGAEVVRMIHTLIGPERFRRTTGGDRPRGRSSSATRHAPHVVAK